MELASRTLRHLEADKDDDYLAWKPDENGFVFTREQVELYAQVANDDDDANSPLPIPPVRLRFVTSEGVAWFDSFNPHPSDAEEGGNGI